MKRNRKELLLKEPNIYKAFTILAVPVFLSNLLRSMHDLVDTYFVGQIENSVSAQAAISLSWPLLNILLALGMGISVAGVAIISNYIGKGSKKEAQEYAGTMFILCFFLGIIVNVIIYFSSSSIMSLTGAEGEVLELSVIYLQVRSFEMIPMMLFMAFQSMRNATGDTTTPVYISTITILFNVVLTFCFVSKMDMGIFGAAFATLIAQIITTPLAIYMAFRPNEFIYITLKNLVPQKEKINKLVKIAIPSALGQAVSSLGFLVLNGVILSYGTAVVAAFSNGNKVSNILLMPIMSLGSVQAAYIGQNLGADNKERTLKSYYVGRNLSLLLSIVGCFILFPFRYQVASLLSNSPEVIEICAEYMAWVILIQPLMAMFQNYMGTFNGTGKTIYSLIFSSTRLWLLRLPMIFLFKNFTDLGRTGIWCAMVLSNVVVLFLGHYLIIRLHILDKKAIDNE